MKELRTGWVIINVAHPRTGAKFIVGETYSSLRKEAIRKFIDGSGFDWRYWRRKFNFECVRADQVITVELFEVKTKNSQNATQ